jgi:hypothetical protein
MASTICGVVGGLATACGAAVALDAPPGAAPGLDDDEVPPELHAATTSDKIRQPIALMRLTMAKPRLTISP